MELRCGSESECSRGGDRKGLDGRQEWAVYSCSLQLVTSGRWKTPWVVSQRTQWTKTHPQVSEVMTKTRQLNTTKWWQETVWQKKNLHVLQHWRGENIREATPNRNNTGGQSTYHQVSFQLKFLSMESGSGHHRVGTWKSQVHWKYKSICCKNVCKWKWKAAVSLL